MCFLIGLEYFYISLRYVIFGILCIIYGERVEKDVRS
jgi:hypothetical protein